MLSSISIPTRVVVGEKDGITPPEVAREMCKAIKHAKLVTLADAGHLSNLEQPAKFSAALRDLVDDCR
jgi:pimeloyl-ACP methyl ester carboxylesterase